AWVRLKPDTTNWVRLKPDTATFVEAGHSRRSDSKGRRSSVVSAFRRTGFTAASRLLNRRLRVEAAPFGYEPFQQRRRLPIVAKARTILVHAREHEVETDRVGVKHRAAAVAREPEAVDVNDVDV